MEEYGKTIFQVFIAVIVVGMLFLFVLSGNSNYVNSVDKSTYKNSTEKTMENYRGQIVPTIKLSDRINKDGEDVYETNRNNIHLIPGEGYHDFKKDIELTDNGIIVNSNLVNYRILSTAFDFANPTPGYYLIKYWYRSSVNDTVTVFLATIVVH